MNEHSDSSGGFLPPPTMGMSTGHQLTCNDNQKAVEGASPEGELEPHYLGISDSASP